jgi:outer membrane protein OmpA-like peptidoglycan-associated protein
MIQFATHHRVYGLAVGSFAMLVGCSTTTTVVGPPPELAQARAAYGSAANGPAAQYAPAQLHEAKRTLDRAEALYRSQPTSAAARGQAYVALRRAEIADADAGMRVAQAQREQASLMAAEAQARRMQATEAELKRARQELAQERCGQEERQGSSGSERPCPQSSRTDLIVLPGAALFETGSSDLSTAARANLTSIAKTLKNEHNRRVRVEGFTDATGDDKVNGPLSEARAEAVRGYLVSCGVDASRIQTLGLGSSRPIGDETTAAGRAANRRVRIVVEPSTGVAEPMR